MTRLLLILGLSLSAAAAPRPERRPCGPRLTHVMGVRADWGGSPLAGFHYSLQETHIGCAGPIGWLGVGPALLLPVGNGPHDGAFLVYALGRAGFSTLLLGFGAEVGVGVGRETGRTFPAVSVGLFPLLHFYFIEPGVVFHLPLGDRPPWLPTAAFALRIHVPVAAHSP